MKIPSFIKKLHISNERVVCNIPLLLLELVLLVITMYGADFILNMTSIQKVTINEADIVVNKMASVSEPLSGKKTVHEEEPEKEGFRNIALFGVDSRSGSLDRGRSDTIMVASINVKTHEVSLVSIYRDTYLNVGDDTFNKCNVAYAKGGAKQAINMLNMNLDLDITDYVTVGFEGLIKAIDSLGGVEIDVQENEIVHLNSYQKSMFMEDENDTRHLNEDIVAVTHSGPQTLSGLQATAYCRIRYVGDDYARTERQRKVIQAMMLKASGVSVPKLTSTAYSMTPYMSTSLSVGEVVSVLGDIGGYRLVESEGLPFDEYRDAANLGKLGACIVPVTLEDNVKKLHELLFDEADYRVSPTVEKISAQIKENTSVYLDSN